MRRPLPKPSMSQNTCIFCAMRRLLKPATPAVRRLLQSSSIAHIPASAAAVQRCDAPEPNSYDPQRPITRNSSAPSHPSSQTPGRRRLGGGWAKAPPDVKLTPEEENQRSELLRSEPEPDPNRFATRQFGSISPRPLATPAGQSAVSGQPDRFRNSSQPPSAWRNRVFGLPGPARQPRDLVLGSHHASGRSGQTEMPVRRGREGFTSAGRPSGMDRLVAPSANEGELDVAQGWKHVRRRFTPRPVESGVSETPPAGDRAWGFKAEVSEQERVERLKAAADGAYVAFNTASASPPLFRKATPFKDRPPQNPDAIVSWKALASANANPLGQLHKAHGQYYSDPGSELASRGIFSSPLGGRAAGQSYAPNRPGDLSAAKIRAARRAAKFTEPTGQLSPRREGRREYARRQQSFRQYDEADEDAGATRQERKRKRKLEKLAQKAAAPAIPILLPEFISVGNLAAALHLRVEDFRGRLRKLGFDTVDYDHVLDAETAGLIATEFNYEPVVGRDDVFEDLVPLPPVEDKSLLSPRPPVITIMGHVDHGKTTLLDWLRKSSVAASEHGGITQHIGAFTVPMPSGKTITFLDTPGHAAFLSMRQRGAHVTDIVILVVAADDSVKPQTIEAIKHAHAANVPIIVAINKIDKDDADPERVKQDLARHGVNVESFGGDTQAICVSGKTGAGMLELEDAAIALSDVLDLRAPTTGPAEGWILEATTKRAGRVATVLVRRGTLQPGAVVVAGSTWARVRVLRDEAGASIPAAGPGVPVEIDGWRDQPEAGAELLQAADEHRARSIVDVRIQRAEKQALATDVVALNEARRLEHARRLEQGRVSAANRAPTNAASNIKRVDGEANGEAGPAPPAGPIEVPFMLRADVAGSVEALQDAVLGLGNGEVQALVLRAAAGRVGESDVERAAAVGGCIVNFNQGIDAHIARLAATLRVLVLDGSVIYRVVDAVKARLEEALPEKAVVRVIGEADVLMGFEIGKRGKKALGRAAGCRVRNGVVVKGGRVRVLRNAEVIYDGTLSSLKNVKKDVAEMRKGSECGLGFDGFEAFEVGDLVQSYEEKFEKRTL